MPFLLSTLLALAASAAAAETPAAPASAETPHYRSAFDNYRPFKDPSVGPWRDVNDEVTRIGGHAGSLNRGATPPAPAPGSAKTTPPPATTPNHAQHHR